MISAALALALALTAGPLPSAPDGGVPSHWASVSEAERRAELSARAGAPLAERVLAASAGFLGTPYVISPLGEGQGVDPDPLSRFDAVDCLTFVEQTLALALARRAEDYDGLLVALRYQGQTPLYEERNHLMEAQWLPSNQRKGFLVDVTRAYGGEDTEVTYKVLSERNWSSKSSHELGLPPARQAKGRFALNMIPLEKVLAHARAVPSGTLLAVIRADLPLKATRITHVGFVVQKGKRTWLRHAARSFGKTVDEDLESFLLRNSKYGKWKVDGVSLFAVKEPGRAMVDSR